MNKTEASSTGAVRLALFALLVTVGAAIVVPSSPAGTAAAPKEFGLGGWSRVVNDPTPGYQAASYRNVKDLGAKWVRIDVGWDDVEEIKGHYDWSLTDKIASSAKANGVKLLAVLQRSPTWARPRNIGENYPSTTPAELAMYKTFVTAFAKRYTLASNVKVQAIEVWNEPNVPGAWLGSMAAARYVNLLRTAFQAIKAVNKATPVITGGLAPALDSATSVNARTYLVNLYKAGAKPYFNAVGMHPYTWPNKPSDGLKNGWGNMTLDDGAKPSLRKTMTKYGDSAKQIRNTEFGSPVSKVGEAKQAVIAADAVKVWKSYPWAGVFIYMSYQDMKNSRWEGTGLVRDEYTKRPAYTAFKNAVKGTSTK